MESESTLFHSRAKMETDHSQSDLADAKLIEQFGRFNYLNVSIASRFLSRLTGSSFTDIGNSIFEIQRLDCESKNYLLHVDGYSFQDLSSSVLDYKDCSIYNELSNAGSMHVVRNALVSKKFERWPDIKSISVDSNYRDNVHSTFKNIRRASVLNLKNTNYSSNEQFDGSILDN